MTLNKYWKLFLIYIEPNMKTITLEGCYSWFKYVSLPLLYKLIECLILLWLNHIHSRPLCTLGYWSLPLLPGKSPDRHCPEIERTLSWMMMAAFVLHLQIFHCVCVCTCGHWGERAVTRVSFGSHAEMPSWIWQNLASSRGRYFIITMMPLTLFIFNALSK